MLPNRASSEMMRARSMAVPLLQAAPDRRDALRVETQPMHPADVPGVLHLDAAVHDERKAACFSNARAFLVDDAELTPQRLRPYRNGVARDARQCIRRSENIDDIHGHWNVGQ